MATSIPAPTENNKAHGIHEWQHQYLHQQRTTKHTGFMNGNINTSTNREQQSTRDSWMATSIPASIEKNTKHGINEQQHQYLHKMK